MVGGGILGAAVARELTLRRPGLRLVLLEKEPELGAHQTGHNSGVVHAGIYYAPGSLKARLCTSGAGLLYEFCDERQVPYVRCGKVIVARDAGELPRLDELERRGRANGVPGLRRISAGQLRELEPHCRGVAALHSPATGVVDFAAVTRQLAREAAGAGVSVHTSCEVRKVDVRGRRLVLSHRAGELRAHFAVFCAGGWADRLAVAAGAPPDPRIVPFRGAYLRLRPERQSLVRALIYPVPDPRLPFLGVHLTRDASGDVLVGPTALLAPARDAYSLRRISGRDLAATIWWPGTWRLVRRWWRTGIEEVRRAVSVDRLVRAAADYVPELRPGDVAPAFAGVRAQALGRDGALLDDFVVSRTERTLHVRNAPSPAATSSLALAQMIADRALEAYD